MNKPKKMNIEAVVEYPRPRAMTQAWNDCCDAHDKWLSSITVEDIEKIIHRDQLMIDLETINITFDTKQIAKAIHNLYNGKQVK